MLEILNLAIPLGLLILALFSGTILERRHFKLIRKREAALQNLPVLSGRAYPTDGVVVGTRMVAGGVVVSMDHFKRFLAGLRKIFGGEVRAYCSLLDRGRREAILRMMEQCPDADLIVNLRVETSSISKGSKDKIGSSEVFAYGTAIWYEQTPGS